MLVTLDDSSVTEEQFWSNNVHSIIDNTNKIYFQVTDNIDLKSTVYVYIDGRKFAHSELAVMNDRGIKVIEVFTYVTILPVGIFSAIIVSDNDKDKIINLLLDSKFLN